MPKQVMSMKMDIVSDTSVAMVKKFLERCPDESTVRVASYTGDRPWESGYSTITVSWTEEL